MGVGHRIAAWVAAWILWLPVWGQEVPSPPAPDPARAQLREAMRAQRMQEPLPDTGSTANFTYVRSSQYEGVYEIYPTGDPEPSIVSENYLRIILRNPMLGDEMRLTALMAFPVMALRWYEMVMPRHFPDASSPVPAEPFQRQALSLDSGEQLVVEQDPLAAPYVRVRMTNADGRVEEFSINRAMAEQILTSTRATDREKWEQFRTYLYRLPEQARYDFKKLTAEELYELAARSEIMQKDEWTRMRNIVEDQWRAQAAAAGRTNDLKAVRADYIEKIKAEWQPRAPGGATNLPPAPVAAMPALAGGRAVGAPPARGAADAEPAPSAVREPAPSAAGWWWIPAVVIVAGGLAGFAFYMGRRTR